MISLLTVVLLGLTAYTFVGYPLVLLALGWLHRPAARTARGKAHAYAPSVAVFVMTYNEERSIAQKIENTLAQDYPRMRVYVVDSASVDSTAAIAGRHPVTVLEQPRREGKAAAVNFALERSDEEVVIVTDANALFSSGAVTRLIGALADTDVAAATGRFYSHSDHASASAQGEGLFWRLEDFMRRRESRLDSVIGVSGEITAFKRSALAGGLDASNLTEDFEMSVRLRRKARVVYVPEAVATEPPALTVADQITQKKRRVIGTLMTLYKHKDML
ncbi:MAG TPA: glycosyltransferase, partial [Candidatus Limnocylindrales bacterium]|nr:glycosyltransferase [Candidatus Limnocylindrales bacterium]